MSLEWILLGLRIVATVILYTFLGVAFYIVWRSLKQAEQESLAERAPASHLRVMAVNGTRAFNVGEILPLQPVTWVGSDAQNTIVLPEATVSARHARLREARGVWWLEDLGSRSGTLLNDLPLAKPTPLADGDIIGIGAARFKLETRSPR
ncbi:MAG: FHA domain-containing protein [Anaerolineae bacterium]